MAVSALARVRRLHAGPDILRQLHPVRLELLARIDGPENLVQELVRRCDLAPYLVNPLMGDVAIRTGRSHTRPVRPVNRLFQFLIDVVAHLMTRDAESFGIGELERPVEAAPEDDTPDEAHDEERGQREARARAPNESPQTRKTPLMLRGLGRLAHGHPLLTACLLRRHESLAAELIPRQATHVSLPISGGRDRKGAANLNQPRRRLGSDVADS